MLKIISIIDPQSLAALKRLKQIFAIKSKPLGRQSAKFLSCVHQNPIYGQVLREECLANGMLAPEPLTDLAARAFKSKDGNLIYVVDYFLIQYLRQKETPPNLKTSILIHLFNNKRELVAKHFELAPSLIELFRDETDIILKKTILALLLELAHYSELKETAKTISGLFSDLFENESNPALIGPIISAFEPQQIRVYVRGLMNNYGSADTKSKENILSFFDSAWRALAQKKSERFKTFRIKLQAINIILGFLKGLYKTETNTKLQAKAKYAGKGFCKLRKMQTHKE